MANESNKLTARMEALIASDAVQKAGSEIQQATLALAMWMIDWTAVGQIAAHVRLERDRNDDIVGVRVLQFCYEQRPIFDTYWTRHGKSKSYRDAFAAGGNPFDSTTDSVFEVNPINLGFFMRSLGLPPVDAALLDALLEAGGKVRTDAQAILAQVRAGSSDLNLWAAPFDDALFVQACLNGAISPEARDVAFDGAKDHISFVRTVINIRRTDLLQELLDRGCPVDMWDKGETRSSLIHFARESEAVTRVLLDRGASTRETNRKGETPLHTAVEPGVMRALIERGANVSAEDNDGLTPLHCAVVLSNKWSHYESGMACIEVLLDAGADPFYVAEEPSRDYLTPFQMAVKNDCVRSVECILQRFPVDHGQRTIGGKTLAQLASKNPEIKALLRSAKASLGIQESIDAGGAGDAQESTPSGRRSCDVGAL